MEAWKILIITLAGAIVVGTVAGICIGKFLVKRAKSERKRLLSTKERIIYSSCVLLGAALILFGVFFQFPSPSSGPPDNGDLLIIDGGIVNNEQPGDGEDEIDGGTLEAEDGTGDVQQFDLPADAGIAVAAA